MKKVLQFSLVALLAIGLQSCSKSGEVTFWQAQGSGYGITVVELGGVTSNITSEYSAAPDCGSSGCAVFSNLDNGSYSYTASDGFAYWSGTVDIDGGCLTMELY